MEELKTQAKVIRRREASTTTYSEKAVMIQEGRPRRQPGVLYSLAERIADTKLHFKNWYYPGSKEAFPVERELQYVDRYFPDTPMGPLLVDEPVHPWDIANAQRKREFLKKQTKFKYLILDPHTDYDGAMVQLSEWG